MLPHRASLNPRIQLLTAGLTGTRSWCSSVVSRIGRQQNPQFAVLLIPTFIWAGLFGFCLVLSGYPELFLSSVCCWVTSARVQALSELSTGSLSTFRIPAIHEPLPWACELSCVATEPSGDELWPQTVTISGWLVLDSQVTTRGRLVSAVSRWGLLCCPSSADSFFQRAVLCKTQEGKSSWKRRIADRNI